MRTDKDIEETLKNLKEGLKVTWCYSSHNGKTYWRLGYVEKINKKTATVNMTKDNNHSVVPSKKMRIRLESLRIK